LNEIKCPFCGSMGVAKVVNHIEGATYVLGEMTPDAGLPQKYLPVNVFGCPNCKMLFLTCDSLRPASTD
jgi:hypothetical protein